MPLHNSQPEATLLLLKITGTIDLASESLPLENRHSSRRWEYSVLLTGKKKKRGRSSKKRGRSSYLKFFDIPHAK